MAFHAEYGFDWTEVIEQASDYRSYLCPIHTDDADATQLNSTDKLSRVGVVGHRI